MQLQTQKYNPQFKALHIANCGDLKLYKITDRADFKFLKSLPDRIHTKDLMPNLTKDEYSRWDEMLQYAVDNSQKPKNITYVETLNDTPCGIITFTYITVERINYAYKKRTRSFKTNMQRLQ